MIDEFESKLNSAISSVYTEKIDESMPSLKRILKEAEVELAHLDLIKM